MGHLVLSIVFITALQCWLVSAAKAAAGQTPSCTSMTSEISGHNKTNVVLLNSEMFVIIVLQG